MNHTHQTDQKSQVSDHIQLDSFYEILKSTKQCDIPLRNKEKQDNNKHPNQQRGHFYQGVEVTGAGNLTELAIVS